MAFGFPASVLEQIPTQADQQTLAQVIPSVLGSLGWLNYQQGPFQFSATVSAGLMSYGETIDINLGTPGMIYISSKCSFAMQMFDWGKNARNIAMFVGRLNQHLG